MEVVSIWHKANTNIFFCIFIFFTDTTDPNSLQVGLLFDISQLTTNLS